MLDHLNRVLKAGNRAADLTSQLLMFGRRDTAQASVVDLNTVLREVSELLERTLGEHIEVALAPGRDLWMVVADPSQLGQVVLNLAINARDAMDTGGNLTPADRQPGS